MMISRSRRGGQAQSFVSQRSETLSPEDGDDGSCDRRDHLDTRLSGTGRIDNIRQGAALSEAP
nr:hypothetical protein [uncultured Brevundimonas sp.]